MPQNSFLGLAILSATAPLYAHYATLGRDWGPAVLDDQVAAGAVMWVAGDLVFLIAILGIVVGWMRREERETRATDRVPTRRGSSSESGRPGWPSGWPASGATADRRLAREPIAPGGQARSGSAR